MSLVLGPLKKKAEAKEELRKAREAKKTVENADREPVTVSPKKAAPQAKPVEADVAEEPMADVVDIAEAHKADVAEAPKAKPVKAKAAKAPEADVVDVAEASEATADSEA